MITRTPVNILLIYLPRVQLIDKCSFYIFFRILAFIQESYGFLNEGRIPSTEGGPPGGSRNSALFFYDKY